MWLKIKAWFKAHGWAMLELARLVAWTGFFIAGVAFMAYTLWKDITAEPVTTMSQQQAETPTGVQEAADNAKVKLDSSQVKEASSVIREIRITEKEPVYVVQTTGDKAQEESERAVKQEDADFAIVTDKNNPEQEVKLDELGEDTKVELNQYNIQAFKKNLNTVEYQPTEKVIGYTHQWKVTDSGRYMGVGVDYDLDDKKIYAKITYTW